MTEKYFPLTGMYFPLTRKCFPLTNFPNDKQTQESLENGFLETTFQETTMAQVKDIEPDKKILKEIKCWVRTIMQGRTMYFITGLRCDTWARGR